MLAAACYWLSSHCIPTQKFVSLSADLTMRLWLQQKGCALSLLFIVYMDWIDSHSWIVEDVTFQNCTINCSKLQNETIVIGDCPLAMKWNIIKQLLHVCGNLWDSDSIRPGTARGGNSETCAFNTILISSV